MRWTYKHHSRLASLLYIPSRITRFALNLSWLYAHYRNGTYPYADPDRPRTFFKDRSHWQNIKSEWHYTGQDES